MGGKADERLRWKEPLQSLEVELQVEFGLTPVCGRALIKRLEQFLDDHVDGQPGSRGLGQIRYSAVALGERAGKPVRHCRTIPVVLTWLHPGDARVLHDDGSPALRQVRLSRLSTEAYRQGAVLSHEDLSLLVGVELSTVRRLARACAEHGHKPPTRGLIEDIGPTVSHKQQVIRLYFRGLLPGRIAARTGHSLGSVERYLADFARVAELIHRRRLTAAATVRITGMSPSLVRSYVDLLEEFAQPDHQSVLDRLLTRFGPLEPARKPRRRSHNHG